MNVEPDGPLYELPVLGSVVSEKAKRQSTPIVLSDRCFIYFGGVGTGKTLWVVKVVHCHTFKVLWDKMNLLMLLFFDLLCHHYREKKFRLKNQTQYSLKLKLEVRDDSHVFKVRDFYVLLNCFLLSNFWCFYWNWMLLCVTICLCKFPDENVGPSV